MLAEKRAVLFAQELGISKSTFEGDLEIDINALQRGDIINSAFGHLVKDTMLFGNSF